MKSESLRWQFFISLHPAITLELGSLIILSTTICWIFETMESFLRSILVFGTSFLDIFSWEFINAALMAAMIIIAADPVTLRFLRLPPGGIMLTWLALFVLKLATMLLESTAFRFKLLLLLLLLLMLLLMLITKVMMPIAKEAKSTAFEPLMIEVEAAFVHETAGGALWYMKGRSWVDLFFFFLLCLRFFSDGDIQEEKEWEGPFLP